jgi:hypothetical protein
VQWTNYNKFSAGQLSGDEAELADTSHNVGHFYFNGCFRCHDGQHVSADGRVIRKIAISAIRFWDRTKAAST